jgi:hypothetical protein
MKKSSEICAANFMAQMANLQSRLKAGCGQDCPPHNVNSYW